MSNQNDSYNWHSLLTFMVKFQDDACKQKAACDSLRSGIECNPSLCDLIGEESDSLLPIHNCVNLALNLHKKDVYLFQSACGAIYQLSMNCKRIQESYVVKGIFATIIEELLNTPCDHAIQGWGLHALRGLSHDHLIQKELIFTYHIFKHIVRILIEIKSVCVLKQCIGLLACLAQDLETFRNDCIDFGIPVVILDIMIENIKNEELVEIALEALAYFFPYQEEMLLKLANIQSIHNVMRFYQFNEGINLKACVIIQLIAVHKNFIEQKDVFSEIVAMIKDAINGLLQRFEVLLPISQDEYLVTSKLQSSFPQHLTEAKLSYFEDPNVITRRYDFPHIPIGFWPRLLARILSFPKLTPGAHLEKLNLEMDYWQNGVFLHCSQSFCLVSGDEKNLNILDVQSQRSFVGYQLFVSVIDLIDGIVDEWYPGLNDISQKRIVKRLVPCHNCKLIFLSKNDIRFSFDLNMCIASSYDSDSIKCNECGRFSSISYIAPDAVFADLGNLVVSKWKNKFLDKKYKLGFGAFASVYKVKIDGTFIAAKVFNESSGNCPNRMLRHEVDIIKRLHHPCLISFIGVSIRPRALLLEYSPLGNLADSIASQKISKNKTLKHRIALQIAEGLDFIHKHDIVYRDLKPSNILVFSYSLTVPVNIKLSDYGISQHGTYQGFIANKGTPKYKAPEVEDSEYSTEVDILSYGVTIYELVTNGQRPFRDLSYEKEFKDAVLNNKPIDSLISHGFEPWPDVEDLIKSCLRKNPEERPKAETIVNILINTDFFCLKKHLVICKGFETIDCLTTCTFFDSKIKNVEVWAACGGCGLNSHLSWFSATQTNKQVVQGTMTKIGQILCMISYKHFIIVGTKERRVALYDAQEKCFKHKLAQFSDSILCILHAHGFNLFLFGLADGNIAILNFDDVLNPDGNPRYISLNDKISQNPITCMTQSQDKLICGYGKDIKVLNLSTFDLLQTVSATCQIAVSAIIVFQNRLIVSSEKDYKISVYKYTGNRVDEIVLFEFDCSKFLKKFYPSIIESDCYVNTFELVDNSSLWIGCGGGHIIIVNVLKSFFRDATIISRHLGAVRSIISTPKISGESVSVITGGQGFRPLLAINNNVEECGYILLWDSNIFRLKNHLTAERKNRDELLTKLSVKTEKFAFPLL